MDHTNRPRGRDKNVTEGGKGAYRRGDGLGTGPVGSSDGYSSRQDDGGFGKKAVTRGGSGSLIVIVLFLLFKFFFGGTSQDGAHPLWTGDGRATRGSACAHEQCRYAGSRATCLGEATWHGPCWVGGGAHQSPSFACFAVRLAETDQKWRSQMSDTVFGWLSSCC